MAEGDDASAEIYREAVLDAASAILLHNYYKHVLQKPPFALPPLSRSVTDRVSSDFVR